MPSFWQKVPWPSNPCFFLLKKRGPPEKSKDFPLCQTLQILGKESKNAPKFRACICTPLKTLSSLINEWGFLFSLIFPPSRRADTKESSLISEGKRVSSLNREKILTTILVKIITRMKLLFSNRLGDYSYSFQGSSELISITVTISLFFLPNGVTGNNSPQEFSRVSGNYSYMIQWFSNWREWWLRRSTLVSLISVEGVFRVLRVFKSEGFGLRVKMLVLKVAAILQGQVARRRCCKLDWIQYSWPKLTPTIYIFGELCFVWPLAQRYLAMACYAHKTPPPKVLWKLASVLDSWDLNLKPSCNFLWFPAMCPPRKTVFFCRKVHFSAGKCIFLQESAFFGTKLHFSVGRCIFLPENLFFCSLLRGAKNHEW